MSSEPEYFYTVELPERYGRMLEQLAAQTGGLYDAEGMAAFLLRGALDANLLHSPPTPAEMAEMEAAEREARRGPRARGPSGDLDDDIPF